VSASLASSGARPDGNAVATLATPTPLPSSARTATPTRSEYTQTVATFGTFGSSGSGRTAFAHRARTFPAVSAPSRVVRSIIEMARSIAYALAAFLIERVASRAARSSTPTWSTPGSPRRVSVDTPPASPTGTGRHNQYG